MGLKFKVLNYHIIWQKLQNFFPLFSENINFATVKFYENKVLLLNMHYIFDN